MNAPYSRSMSRKKRFRFYAFVGTEDRQMSTAWYFFADRTSFYLTNADLGGLKVSLHGRDPRHPGQDHYRIYPVDGGLTTDGPVLLVPPRSGWPIKFTGQRGDHGDLVIRIRTTFAATQLVEPPTPVVESKSSATSRTPPCRGGWSNDLDLTFSQVPPGFHPSNTHADWLTFNHAGTSLYIGRHQPGFMIRSSDGAVLRGRSHSMWTDWNPTPPHLLTEPSEPLERPRRAVSIDVDADGMLWIVEHVTPPALVDEGSFHPAQVMPLAVTSSQGTQDWRTAWESATTGRPTKAVAVPWRNWPGS